MAFGSGKKRRSRELAELLDSDMVGLLEPGVEFEGRMRFTSGMIRLNAHYRGEITSEGTIVVADQGEVEAEIHARVVSIAGKVKGAVHASERIEIKEHGLVLGDIYTPCLVVDPGGFFDGQCHMPAPEPQKAEASLQKAEGTRQ
ncbi:MAG: polymer-forming cytoskeletal protein [Terriglobia bacterium]|jgi:cytoskeletal protein CcmA (bactofilin family)